MSVTLKTNNIMFKDAEGNEVYANAVGGPANLENIQVFILDFINDDISMYHGAIDGSRRIATT